MVSRIIEQEAAIRQVLREKETTWLHHGRMWFLESISAALTPLQDFTDMLSGEEYAPVSAIKPLVKHFRDMLLIDTEGESELTKDITRRVLQTWRTSMTAQVLAS